MCLILQYHQEMKLLELFWWRYRRGFTNSGVDMTVLDNGTMIFSSQLFPTFGYSSDRELSQKGLEKNMD